MQALVDVHAKRCKLRTETESARVVAVAQRTSFVDLEESKSRLIPELEELMTCSHQSGTKFDQASLQVESGHEAGWVRFSRVFHSRSQDEKVQKV